MSPKRWEVDLLVAPRKHSGLNTGRRGEDVCRASQVTQGPLGPSRCQQGAWALRPTPWGSAKASRFLGQKLMSPALQNNMVRHASYLTPPVLS